jgi:hypothetical protein
MDLPPDQIERWKEPAEPSEWDFHVRLVKNLAKQDAETRKKSSSGKSKPPANEIEGLFNEAEKLYHWKQENRELNRMIFGNAFDENFKRD